jgi:hypothetical protein
MGKINTTNLFPCSQIKSINIIRTNNPTGSLSQSFDQGNSSATSAKPVLNSSGSLDIHIQIDSAKLNPNMTYEDLLSEQIVRALNWVYSQGLNQTDLSNQESSAFAS